MLDDEDPQQDDNLPSFPDSSRRNKAARGVLNAASATPFIGGIFAAAAGAWSEHEQEQVNNVLQQWLQHLEQELREKGQTMLEIMARMDMQDEEIKQRIESDEFQSLVKKTFQNWSRIDTADKRTRVRNLLSNAAAVRLVSDDVVRLFLDWIDIYSDFHFQVIGVIANQEPVGRGYIWEALGRPPVPEDSADADLYKLLIRDLSTGGLIRQHRATDGHGNFLTKSTKGQRRGTGTRTAKSAFDNQDPYVLTELGRQFVHYAMTEVPTKIEFQDFEVKDPA